MTGESDDAVDVLSVAQAATSQEHLIWTERHHVCRASKAHIAFKLVEHLIWALAFNEGSFHFLKDLLVNRCFGLVVYIRHC
jgi:hypothetical protein